MAHRQKIEDTYSETLNCLHLSAPCELKSGEIDSLKTRGRGTKFKFQNKISKLTHNKEYTPSVITFQKALIFIYHFILILKISLSLRSNLFLKAINDTMTDNSRVTVKEDRTTGGKALFAACAIDAGQVVVSELVGASNVLNEPTKYTIRKKDGIHLDIKTIIRYANHRCVKNLPLYTIRYLFMFPQS